jgi:hypothetical protein
MLADLEHRTFLVEHIENSWDSAPERTADVARIVLDVVGISVQRVTEDTIHGVMYWPFRGQRRGYWQLTGRTPRAMEDGGMCIEVRGAPAPDLPEQLAMARLIPSNLVDIEARIHDIEASWEGRRPKP